MADQVKKVAEQQRFSAKEAEKLTGIKKWQVSRWGTRLEEPEKYRAMLFGAAYAKAMAAKDRTSTKWTGDPESYTPAKYIEAAREVLGGIDLDPASNMYAQKTVKAMHWYDEEENGLLQEWGGTVFLNPPYNFPVVKHFIEKLCGEFQSGNVSAAVLLTNNNTDTAWWQLAANLAAGVCFTAGRINFYKEDGTTTQPTNGQSFFYFGEALLGFNAAFSKFGLILGKQ